MAAARLTIAAFTAIAFAGAVRSDAADAPKPVPADTRTDVVPHPDAPIVAGRNVLWCATSQLAWDALADAIGTDGKLPLGPPAPAALVARMNERSFPHSAIDPKATLVMGGLGSDGIAERVRAAWKAKFGDAVPVPALAAGANDALGIGAFWKDLPFAQPFVVHPEPMSFAGGEKTVRAWGLRSVPGAIEMATQLTAFTEPNGASDLEPVVALRPRDVAEQIVLATLSKPATLTGAWATVEERLRTWNAGPVAAESVFVVPTIVASTDTRFSAIEGAGLPHEPGSVVTSYRQTVRLRLSENGASVGAVAVIEVFRGGPPSFTFDRPFLLALRRVNERRPYLLLWVGNDALLERSP